MELIPARPASERQTLLQPSQLDQRRARQAPTPSRIARRRRLVALAKRLLPVGAVALLGTVALWPELSRDDASRRLGAQRATPESGQMTEATYHGVDERGRPYAVTASAAHETVAGRIELTDPKGDVASGIGAGPGGWALVTARHGVYIQHIGALDLSGDVQFYRDDGTILSTDSADFDLKAGAASGAELVHVEGPFGTLDAAGFAATDRGAVLQFSGPGRLVLNARSR